MVCLTFNTGMNEINEFLVVYYTFVIKMFVFITVVEKTVDTRAKYIN